ncbi:MAG: dethiobiotin synthase [Selenomonas sp.]|uniref:dethiobiotin synthase n=1 Tax=Selenomonas sp. TaxID=2053611 RepID=UPI0025DD655E|nr:dethiobiotin synthase [Selenomonas sp.]MCR5756821.1 dethiobiotin synthase [Selenomonas sp.]
MGKALFITGTGTDIGKTYVTGLIVKKLRDAGLNGGYYKAALSGAEPDGEGHLCPGDAQFVKDMAGLPEPAEKLVSYIYKEAVSPHLAAQWNERPVEMSRIQADFRQAREKYAYLTMEGSGGIICPLRWDAEKHLILDDMVKELQLPVLIIADAGLGTINSAVLTIEHLRHRQIPVKGVIFNNYHAGDRMETDNARMIEEITGVPVIAKVSKGDRELAIDAEELAALYED